MFFNITNTFDLNILEIILFINYSFLNPESYTSSFMTILYSFLLLFSSNVLNLFFFIKFKTNIINAIVFAVKFIVLIALLVFVRGGIPRYRYDFLTKIGWIKFLTLILSVFLTSLLLVYLM